MVQDQGGMGESPRAPQEGAGEAEVYSIERIQCGPTMGPQDMVELECKYSVLIIIIVELEHPDLGISILGEYES